MRQHVGNTLIPWGDGFRPRVLICRYTSAFNELNIMYSNYTSSC
jgi:hypothetical protein